MVTASLKTVEMTHLKYLTKGENPSRNNAFGEKYNVNYFTCN
jgi:hypothetical protein